MGPVYFIKLGSLTPRMFVQVCMICPHLVLVQATKTLNSVSPQTFDSRRMIITTCNFRASLFRTCPIIHGYRILNHLLTQTQELLRSIDRAHFGAPGRCIHYDQRNVLELEVIRYTRSSSVPTTTPCTKHGTIPIFAVQCAGPSHARTPGDRPKMNNLSLV